MNVRLFVGLLLFVGGILALYFAVALSFVAFSKEYVFPLVLLAVILLVFGIWLINPLGIWSDSIQYCNKTEAKLGEVKLLMQVEMIIRQK